MFVKCYKLVDGAEIIGAEKECIDGKVIVSKPRVLQYVPHEGGRMSVGLIPWVISAPDEDVTIKECFILTSLEVGTELSKVYYQQTTGLDLSNIIQ